MSVVHTLNNEEARHAMGINDQQLVVIITTQTILLSKFVHADTLLSCMQWHAGYST